MGWGRGNRGRSWGNRGRSRGNRGRSWGNRGRSRGNRCRGWGWVGDGIRAAVSSGTYW